MTKKEFAPGFREWAGRARIESKYEVKDIHASGDVAYLWSHISIVMTSKESGSSTQREGHVLSVFRKSPSGKWLLAATQTHPHGQAGASVKKIRVSTPGYLYAPLSDIVTSAIKPNVQIEQNSVSFDRFRRGGPLGVRLLRLWTNENSWDLLSSSRSSQPAKARSTTRLVGQGRHLSMLPAPSQVM